MRIKNTQMNLLRIRQRSKTERLFKRYCKHNHSVEWVYKNGDTGQ